MTVEEMAAIYEASNDCADPKLVIAVVRALRDVTFEAETRLWLDAPPEVRRAFAAILQRRCVGPAANLR